MRSDRNESYVKNYEKSINGLERPKKQPKRRKSQNTTPTKNETSNSSINKMESREERSPRIRMTPEDLNRSYNISYGFGVRTKIKKNENSFDDCRSEESFEMGENEEKIDLPFQEDELYSNILMEFLPKLKQEIVTNRIERRRSSQITGIGGLKASKK